VSRIWSAVGTLVLVAWLAAVPLGLARAALGREPAPAEVALWWLPGVLVAMGCYLVAAWPRLVRAAGAWRPGTVVEGLERGPERRARRVATAPAPTPDDDDAAHPLAVAVPPPIGTVARVLPLVHLGPRAEPAYAAWSLRWEAPGHGQGVVVLPFGRHVLVGRAPAADVVIRLDQVSWEHMELAVDEAEVTLLDLESSNGTFAPEGDDGRDGRIEARVPWRWAPRTTIRLARPTAITLTLEPLR